MDNILFLVLWLIAIFAVIYTVNRGEKDINYIITYQFTEINGVLKVCTFQYKCTKPVKDVSEFYQAIESSSQSEGYEIDIKKTSIIFAFKIH